MKNKPNPFTKLQEIAEEMFGVKIKKTEEPMSFKDIFGFDAEDLKEIQKEQEELNHYD